MADTDQHVAVKSPALACLMTSRLPVIDNRNQSGGPLMKRSRRVVLTLMGSATVGAVSMGFAPRPLCGPGLEAVPGPDGRPYCRATYGGFGGAMERLHGPAHGYGHGSGHGSGHGHAHGGG